MKFWCFHFEGYFSDNAPEYPNQGVFSECLVQADNKNVADFAFFEALSENGINLIEISEEFPIDNSSDEMDPENQDNLFWIEWCEEVEITGKPSFEAFNLYPADDVIRPITKDS